MSIQESLLLQSEANEALTTDKRWQLMHQIVESQYFVKAEQLRKILVYVVQRHLLDPTVTFSEQDIACGALGRRGDFNPVDDNIVRVQMGHIRRRLDLYFSTEGRNEPLIMSVPKGTYVPHFEARVEAPTTSEHSLIPVLQEKTPDNRIELPAAKAKGWLNIRYWAIALTPMLCAVLFFVLGRESSKPVSSSQNSPALSTIQNPLLKRIFVTDLPVSIVVADINLVILQNVLHTDISIDQYISKDYPNNILNKANISGDEREILSGLTFRKFTSLADLNVAIKCVELSRDFGARSIVRYSRSLNARDFEKGNFILVGSRTADPWVELFEPQLNFSFEEDPKTHEFYFRNKHPQLGEQLVYRKDYGTGVSTTSYVDIAIVPNLTKTGYVLLFNAATMDANEAAAQLIFSQTLSPVLAKALSSDDKNGNSSIEIFLRDHAVDGVVNGTEVVAVRKI